MVKSLEALLEAGMYVPITVLHSNHSDIGCFFRLIIMMLDMRETSQPKWFPKCPHSPEQNGVAEQKHHRM